MTIERARARVFGEVAEEYDRLRFDYPDELVDDVLAYAALTDKRALEVGAGTGKATLAFARRGISVTAVEPDEAMAAVLTRRVQGYAQVSLVASSFEEYVPSHPFGLLYCAQAWHWIDPAVRWQKAAAALVPGGALALFWNRDQLADPQVREVIVAAQRTFAPDIAAEAIPRVEPASRADITHSWPRTELAALDDFGDLKEQCYVRERTLSATDYTAYLSTHSAYRILDAMARARLLNAIVEQIGPQVRLNIQTQLYLARRVG